MTVITRHSLDIDRHYNSASFNKRDAGHVKENLRLLTYTVHSDMTDADRAENNERYSALPPASQKRFLGSMRAMHTHNASNRLIRKLNEESETASNQDDKDALGFTADLFERKRGSKWEESDGKDLLICLQFLTAPFRQKVIEVFRDVDATLTNRMTAVSSIQNPSE